MDILRKRFWYKFFTKLDVSMQYYTFELDKESKTSVPLLHHLVNTSTWDSRWESNARQTLLKQLCKMYCQTSTMPTFTLMIVVLSLNDWDHHVNLLATILWRLLENGFTINPLKCEWAVKETDWLGYWLTPQGLKPWKKKIDAILHINRPCNATELRMFIGCDNYNVTCGQVVHIS